MWRQRKIKNLFTNKPRLLAWLAVLGLVILILLAAAWSYQDTYNRDHLSAYLPAETVWYAHLNLPWGLENPQLAKWLASDPWQLQSTVAWPLTGSEQDLVDREMALVGWQQTATGSQAYRQSWLIKTKQPAALVQAWQKRRVAFQQLSPEVFVLDTAWPKSSTKPLAILKSLSRCQSGASFCLSLTPLGDSSVLPSLWQPVYQALVASVRQWPAVFSWRETPEKIIWQFFPGQLEENKNHQARALVAALPPSASGALYHPDLANWLPSQVQFSFLATLFSGPALNDSVVWLEQGAGQTFAYLAWPAKGLTWETLNQKIKVALASLSPSEQIKTLPDGSPVTELIALPEKVALQENSLANHRYYSFALPTGQVMAWWLDDQKLVFSFDQSATVQNYWTQKASARRGLLPYQLLSANFWGIWPAWSGFLSGDSLEILGLEPFSLLSARQNQAKVFGFIK